MSYLSSGRRTPAGVHDHRRAGGGDGDHARGASARSRPSACSPTPSCGAAPASTGRSTPTASPPSSGSRNWASRSSRSACSSAPSRPASPSPTSSGSPSPPPQPSDQRTPTRTRARTRPSSTASPSCSRPRRWHAGGAAATALGRPHHRVGRERGLLILTSGLRCAARGSIWSGTVPDTAAVRLLHWEEAAACRSAVAVTTRHGGVSQPPYDTLNLGLHVGDRPADVAVNRARAAAAFGVDLDDDGLRPAGARQRPPRSWAAGTAAGAARSRTTPSPSADILVTTSPGVTLVILVADCVPLALVDPAAGVLAAVHAGWRGTAAGAVAVGAARHGGAGGPARAGAGLPRARGGAGALPGRSDGAAARWPTRRAPGGPRPRRGAAPTARATGWSTSSRPTASSSSGRGVRPEHISASGVTTADEAFFSDRAARPCGRFALMARLLG